MSDVLDRIRKLLRLAGNAGSEHEAALAAKRAADLMAEHEIHEAQLRLDQPDAAPPEAIDEDHQLTKTRKRVAWHATIARAVAESYGARIYNRQGTIRLFGRLSAVQATEYTVQYLFAEVDRLCDDHCDRNPTRGPLGVAMRPDRRYRNAFRLGCSKRIAERIEAQASEAERARKAATAAAREVSLKAGPSSAVAAAGALMLIDKDRAQVESEWTRYKSARGMRTGAAYGSVSSGNGYTAGKAAGDRANLGGGARGALGSGQGSLPRGR